MSSLLQGILCSHQWQCLQWIYSPAENPAYNRSKHKVYANQWSVFILPTWFIVYYQKCNTPPEQQARRKRIKSMKRQCLGTLGTGLAFVIFFFFFPFTNRFFQKFLSTCCCYIMEESMKSVDTDCIHNPAKLDTEGDSVVPLKKPLERTTLHMPKCKSRCFQTDAGVPWRLWQCEDDPKAGDVVQPVQASSFIPSILSLAGRDMPATPIAEMEAGESEV